MKSLSIAVFFDKPDYLDYPFDDPDYYKSYHQFAELFSKRLHRFFIVRSQKTYIGNNRFAGGWKFDGKEFRQVSDVVRADVIYNKGYFKADADANVINESSLENLCTNKLETAEYFATLSPKTAIAHDGGEFQAYVKMMKSDFVVAKPIDQEGGKGVIIAPKDVIASMVKTFPYLVQEFLDSSGGIPGIAKGLHDLRIISIQGKPILSYLREPKAGSFLANESQGGKLTEIPLDKIPKEAINLWKSVDLPLQKFTHRVYATDMCRNVDGKWYIIELNSKPGLDPIGKYEGAKRFMEALVDLLIGAAQK